MSFLTELDVINQMLGTLGESPLNSLDDEHPLVPGGRNDLRIASGREQAKSWWFNKELVTLVPDATTGYITTPSDAIRVDPRDTSLNYVQRGRRLYQAYAGANVDKYKFTLPVECWLVRNLPFEDLPQSAQVYICAAAVLDFQKEFDADSMKYQQLLADKRQALIDLNSENIRNLNINLLTRPSMMASLNRLGMGRYVPR